MLNLKAHIYTKYHKTLVMIFGVVAQYCVHTCGQLHCDLRDKFVFFQLRACAQSWKNTNFARYLAVGLPTCSQTYIRIYSGAESTLKVGGVFQYFSYFFANFRKWGV